MSIDCRNFREGVSNILENFITVALLYYIYCELWLLSSPVETAKLECCELVEILDDLGRFVKIWGGNIPRQEPDHHHTTQVCWYCPQLIHDYFVLIYSLSTDASLCNVSLREKIYLVLFTGFSHAPVCESSGPRLLVESSSLFCTLCTHCTTLYNTVHRAKYNSLANTMWSVQILINNDFAMLIGIKYQRELNQILLVWKWSGLQSSTILKSLF